MPTTTLTEVISGNQEILIQTCIKKLRKNLNTVESMQKIYDIKMKRIIAARGRYRVSMKFYKKKTEYKFFAAEPALNNPGSTDDDYGTFTSRVCAVHSLLHSSRTDIVQ